MLAAEKLGEKPENCIVFEDAKVGIEAAHRAGMQVIGISATTAKFELKDADKIIQDYTYFDENLLK